MKPRKYIEKECKRMGLNILSLSYHPWRYVLECPCCWVLRFTTPDGREWERENQHDTSMEAAIELMEIVEVDIEMNNYP